MSINYKNVTPISKQEKENKGRKKERNEWTHLFPFYRNEPLGQKGIEKALYFYRGKLNKDKQNMYNV